MAIEISMNDRETVIIWDEGKKKWVATSCLDRHISKFVESGWDEIHGEVSEPYRQFEQRRPKAVVFRSMRGRTYTEEQKAEIRERMKKMHSAKKANQLDRILDPVVNDFDMDI